MAVKRLELPDIGTVNLYKHRGSRNIRLTIAHDGTVRVTLPYWLPYQAGLKFLHSKASWIAHQQQTLQSALHDGQSIGKAHRLKLEVNQNAQRVQTQLKDNLAIVKFPPSMDDGNEQVQKAARNISIKALRQEAEGLLPQRLSELAETHNFTYNSVSVRQLKSRWGSCNQSKDITLNLFLMQLPWELIDYVLLHELTHTKVMRHGKPFWDELQRHNPKARQLRKAILNHHPTFNSPE